MEEAHDPDAMAGHGWLVGGLADEPALDELLAEIVVLALHALRPAHSVSITVADNGGYRTTNSTEDEALAIDLAQYAGGEGPCLEAMRSARQVQVAVGADEGRWPRFQERAKEAGVAVVLSTPLVRVPGDAIGALNVYAHDPDGFDEEACRAAELIGRHTAILVGNSLALATASHLNEQLQQALASREIIGEAKGIIMERQRCTRDEAFDILRRASQRENRKLRDLAEELVVRVETRRTDGRPTP